jgi:fibronectin type 3 domain-containing protein
VPTTPRNVTAVPDNKKGIDLAWSPPASDGGSPITAYRIYRSTSPGNETLLTSVAGSASTYRDPTTIRNRSYYYVIRAVNAVGLGPPSSEVTAIAK